MIDTAVMDTITFELVVFERIGDEIQVRVRGMSACTGIELVVFDDGHKATFTPVGSCATDRLREFDLRDAVEASAGKRLEVRGLNGTEVVMVEDITEGYPVVCSADPMAAGLPRQFLHRRGDRYVLMSGDGAAPTPHHRTTLVA